ncbi:MAG: protein-S-isoprenylcysteine O-methyltransferase [Actinomycetota bacterium]
MDVIRRLGPLVIIAALAAGLVWRLDENGWGSFVWLGSLIATVVIRTPFEAETRKNTITEQRVTLTERVLLAGMGVGTMLLPLAQLFTGVFGFADYDLPGWTPAIALLLLVPGFWLFWRSHADLGRNWSVTLEIRDEHTLVTNGVYRRIRHPMYASLFLVYAAMPLAIHNWVAGFGGLVAFLLLYLLRLPREEQMMRDRFGVVYTEYCRHTGRLWPKFRTA